MSDFKLQYVEHGAIDVVILDDDIGLEDGLETAILISLFTDQWVETDELPAGETDQRGWWGDQLSEVDGDEIGSKLWLLARAKTEAETIELAREYSEEALAWLIADGVAKSVVVTVERQGDSRLAIGVVVERPQGKDGRFKYVWDPMARAA